MDGDQWMIYQNVLTGVLHWDFVSEDLWPPNLKL